MKERGRGGGRVGGKKRSDNYLVITQHVTVSTSYEFVQWLNLELS